MTLLGPSITLGTVTEEVTKGLTNYMGLGTYQVVATIPETGIGTGVEISAGIYVVNNWGPTRLSRSSMTLRQQGPSPPFLNLQLGR